METDRGQVTATLGKPILLAQYYNVATGCPVVGLLLLADRIVGAAGTGLADNTFCVHKRLTLKRQSRLLLQLQFALFD
jgi:hypothetical protein